MTGPNEDANLGHIMSRERKFTFSSIVMHAQAGIQYAAASRLKHQRLWNTGSSACAGDDSVTKLFDS